MKTEENVIVRLLRKKFIDVADESDIELCQYSGSWRGVSDSKSRQFRAALRRMGERVGLAYIGSELYWYNGKIYERIDKQIVRNAYTDMIDHFLLSGWIIGNRLFFEDSFLRSIRENKSYSMDVNLFAFSNGVLDMRGGKVKFCDFSPEFAVTHLHDFKYDDKAGCPKWHAFLREVLPDKTQRVILQMSMGLGLCNRNEIGTIEQCLVLYGAGGNGKGVVYRLMRDLFGGELMSCVSVKDLCSPSDNGLRARYELRGKIFNWNSDENSDFMRGVDPAAFKRIVSGEPVNDRKIGGDIGENNRLPYMAFNTNHLPRMGELTDAMMRRWQIIAFESKVDDKKINPLLGNELLKERSGVFNWILRGMRELRRRKFLMPQSRASENAKLKMMFENDPRDAFLSAYGVRFKPAVRGEQSVCIPKKVMTASLNMFAKENGFDGEFTELQLGCALRKKNHSEMVHSCTEKGVKCWRLFGVNAEMLSKVLYIGDEHEGAYVFERGTYIDDND